MKKIYPLVSLCLFLSISSFGFPSSPTSTADTVYRIVKAANETYGYEIMVNKRMLIKQLSVPSRPGTNGFKKKQDARKVAQLVIAKLSKGIMPPTVHEKELLKLKIKL